MYLKLDMSAIGRLGLTDMVVEIRTRDLSLIPGMLEIFLMYASYLHGT